MQLFHFQHLLSSSPPSRDIGSTTSCLYNRRESNPCMLLLYPPKIISPREWSENLLFLLSSSDPFSRRSFYLSSDPVNRRKELQIHCSCHLSGDLRNRRKEHQIPCSCHLSSDPLNRRKELQIPCSCHLSSDPLNRGRELQISCSCHLSSDPLNRRKEIQIPCSCHLSSDSQQAKGDTDPLLLPPFQ